jgi:GntR family transcriptional regulator
LARGRNPGGVSCTIQINFLNFSKFKRKEGEAMISLNYRDSRPIYEQIKDGLKKLIVTGALAANEKLPSVRALATQLSINPNTIQRAYNELESEGYIYSIPGKGSFAAQDAGGDEKRKQELKEKLRDLAAELRYLGVSQEELLALMREESET